MNLQIKLKNNEKIIQKLNDYIKKLNKDILKLKNKNEKDKIQNSVNMFVIDLKENILNELTEIMSTEKENT